MNVTDEIWMLLHLKYAMSRIMPKLHWIKSNRCCYLSVTKNIRLNWLHNELYWLSMKVSALKICNEETQIIQNCIQSVKNNYSYLSVTKDVWLNRQNCEWEWFSKKVSASKVCNELNHMRIAFNWKQQLLLPWCYRQFSI